MGRRLAGEGTIRQRADGRWEARFYLPTLGERRRVSVYGRTAGEVRKKLEAAKRRANRGWRGDERTTVAELLDHWLGETKDKRRPNTNRSYRDIVDKQLVPYLGRARLAKLRTKDVDEALNKMADDGVGARTRQLARAVLRAALNDAIRWDMVERNVAELSSPVRHAVAERKPLSEEQLQALGERLVGHPLEAAFLFLATTGARRGEVAGLRWDDLDLDGGKALIRRSLQRVPGERVDGGKRRGGSLVPLEPKTERSRREVPLAPLIVEAFERRRVSQDDERRRAGSAWVETGYVFTTAIGTPLDPAVPTHAWEALREQIGAPEARLHDLRHTVATFGLKKTADSMAVSRLLGHSRVSTTTDIYGHELQEGRSEVVATMGGMIRGNGTNAASHGARRSRRSR
jgi:integrase